MKKPCMARIGQQRTQNTQRKTAALAWSCGTVELPANTIASTVLGSSGIQKRTDHQEQSGKAVKKNLQRLGCTWEEAETAAVDRQEWCARCIYTDVGWIKVRIKERSIDLGQN